LPSKENPGSIFRSRAVAPAIPPVRLRILVADDHPIIREGIKTALSGSQAIVISVEASTLAEIEECAAKRRFDAVLLDLSFPDGSGLTALRTLRALHPRVPVVVFTNDYAAREEAMAAGASAFLTKDADPSAIVDALYLAVGTDGGAAAAAPQTDGDRYQRLSKREQEILSRMVAGRRNKEIAFELAISPKTVATHRVRLLRKLALSDDRELLLYAVRNGLADWA
jgi:DNA-binding NarL/FixJ family response regulator